MARPDADRLLDDKLGIVAEMEETLSRIRKDLPTVMARAKAGSAGADGFPRSTALGGGRGPAGFGDPVGSLVLALVESDQKAGPSPDPVRTARNAILFHLQEAARHLRQLDGERASVMDGAPREPEAEAGSRQPLVRVPDCLVGGHPALPRPRRGLCEACYRVWVRDGRPDIGAIDAGEPTFGSWAWKRRRYLDEQAAAMTGRAAGVPLAALTARGVPLSEVCALCGHDPACGRATAFEGRRQVVLCHDDDHSCYHRWTVYGIRPEVAA